MKRGATDKRKNECNENQCATKIKREMSRSIHTTFKNVKGLTKNELEEQFNETDSDLAKLAKKSGIKNQVRKIRKQSRIDKKN